MPCPYHCYYILAGTGAIARPPKVRSPARENAIAVENVGARHQQMIGKDEKCNYRRAQTRSPVKMRSRYGPGVRQ
ncbi:MAG: hypothetical protein AB4352_20515 [Hormoscilla sp.]